MDKYYKYLIQSLHPQINNFTKDTFPAHTKLGASAPEERQNHFQKPAQPT